MNNYKNIQKLKDKEFKRLTWIKKGTYEEIVIILRNAEKEKYSQWWKPNKLEMEDRVLMWLEYMREYRTYFHVWKSYGISESTCYRNCVWIENILIKSWRFSLPWKKALHWNEDIEIILIDATESPIERPKKN